MESLRASGKGWTFDDARASCLGEAVERFSGMFRGDEPRVSASYREIEGRSVAPSALLQFSGAQYEQRDIWNAAFEGAHFIPEPWQPDEPLEWVAATSLPDGDPVWVPAGCCYLRYAPPAPRIVFPNDTTGFAAGPTLEDAAARAFLELVERDAVALWWYNRCPRPRLDRAALRDQRIEAVTDHLASHSRTLDFLDLTTDFDIPVVAAVSATLQGDAILFGFAADFDPAEAARRAALELVQILGPPELWGRDAMLAHYRFRRDRKAWIEWASLAQHPYLVPVGSAPLRPFPLAADRLQACASAARRVGLDLLWVDVTRPDLGVPVARVLAPGARSSWRRLGPGRIYDAPVRLGWLDTPTPEERLNSFPFFL